MKDKTEIRQKIGEFIPKIESAQEIYRLFGILNYPKEVIFNTSAKRKLDEFFGGDLSGVEDGRYHDCESSIADDVGDVEVYKVNHLGSAYSSNPVFISRLDPEVSIISAGDSPHKHPRESTVKRLLNHPSIVYQTHSSNGYKDDKIKVVNGNIEIRTSGKGFTVNGDEYTSEK